MLLHIFKSFYSQSQNQETFFLFLRAELLKLLRAGPLYYPKVVTFPKTTTKVVFICSFICSLRAQSH